MDGDISSCVSIPIIHSIKTKKKNGECNKPDSENDNDDDANDADDDDDDDDDNDEDDDDEEGLIKPSLSEPRQSQIQNIAALAQHYQASNRNALSNSNGFLSANNKSLNASDDINTNMLQAHFAQMIAAANSGQHLNDHHHVDSTMNTLAHIQRNILLQFFNDPSAATQAAQAAAATAAVLSTTSTKSSLASMPVMSSTTAHDKQAGSGRKRKSTPEKRVVTNHRLPNDNGDVG
jgi:hypothetical protein